jgi:hypothetical protein
MQAPIQRQSTTFYEQLKTCPKLDLRDPRGKIHDIGYVLLGVMIGLFRNKDGCLSSIHRSMESTHDCLVNELKLLNTTVISRSQLPIVLKK